MMFDKYLEEKMIIRIQIRKEVFLKYFNKDHKTMSETITKANEAVKGFDQMSKEKPE